MRKGLVAIGVMLVTLLMGCTNKEEGFSDVDFSNSTDQEHSYSGGVILDAIVDTEAEYKYLQEIHEEYNVLRSDYVSVHGYVSSVLGSGDVGAIKTTSEQVVAFKTEMSTFKAKIGNINLPSVYGESLNEAISCYIELVNIELERLNKKPETVNSLQQTVTLTEKDFNKAEEVHLAVQRNYSTIINKR